MKMKSCHTAALAYVLWYLMIPPIGADNKVDAHAPLSNWRRGVSFNSQKECDDSLKDAIQNPMTPDEYRDAAKQTRKAKMRPLSMSEMAKRTLQSQCVAADDPRLKAKAKSAMPK
jgi:hypothetical protein